MPDFGRLRGPFIQCHLRASAHQKLVVKPGVPNEPFLCLDHHAERKKYVSWLEKPLSQDWGQSYESGQEGASVRRQQEQQQ